MTYLYSKYGLALLLLFSASLINCDGTSDDGEEPETKNTADGGDGDSSGNGDGDQSGDGDGDSSGDGDGDGDQSGDGDGDGNYERDCPEFAATPPVPDKFVKIAAADYYACGLTLDGTIKCWGDADNYIEPEGEGHLDFGVGRSGLCYLDAEGTAKCIINPSSISAANIELFDDAPATKFVSISVGDLISCGITSEGSVECWGREPSQIAPPSDSFTQVSGHFLTICGLTEDDTIKCWGNEGNGAINAPTQSGFTAVATGDEIACALDEEHVVHCWGAEDKEYDGACRQTSAFTTLEPKSAKFTQIDVTGSCEACGVLDIGKISCWGSLSRAADVPKEIENVKQVALGDVFGCALDQEGTVRCWGKRDECEEFD